MGFPNLSNELMLERLEPPQGKVRMVLDTDTYNEIDDQFALVYSLISPEKISLEAVYAAPFHNDRSEGPADGMEKSYEEILRLLELLDRPADGFAFKGSTSWLSGRDKPEDSPAALDLVQKAGGKLDDPLYVVAIGAITNVASALLIEPAIVERVVLVWLGGNAHYWPTAREFNLKQDPAASKLVFDCGVPLVHIPCFPVTTHLRTVLPELEAWVKGKGPLGDYLYRIYRDYTEAHWGPAERHCGRSKCIWDMVTIGWLLNHAWVPSEVTHAPILTSELTWSEDLSRHFCRMATYVERDPIFEDFFRKLQAYAEG